MIPSRWILAAAFITWSAGAAVAGPAVVTANNLNLRAGPGAEHRVLTRLPRGATVNALNCGTEWCRVQYRGATGYVVAEHLSAGAASYAAAVGSAPEHLSVVDRGARIWQWDDRQARDRAMREIQWRSRHQQR